LKYLTDLVPDLVVENDYDLSKVNQEAFSDAVDDLHKFACWGLSFYGSCPALADVRDSLGKLQENVWERVIDIGFGELACKRIGAAINAPSSSSFIHQVEPSVRKHTFNFFYCRTKTWFSLQWLKEKKIVGRILNTAYYIMGDVPEASSPLSQVFAVLSMWFIIHVETEAHMHRCSPKILGAAGDAVSDNFRQA
jgi:hypothetical protein